MPSSISLRVRARAEISSLPSGTCSRRCRCSEVIEVASRRMPSTGRSARPMLIQMTAASRATPTGTATRSSPTAVAVALCTSSIGLADDHQQPAVRCGGRRRRRCRASPFTRTSREVPGVVRSGLIGWARSLATSDPSLPTTCVVTSLIVPTTALLGAVRLLIWATTVAACCSADGDERLLAGCAAARARRRWSRWLAPRRATTVAASGDADPDRGVAQQARVDPARPAGGLIPSISSGSSRSRCRDGSRGSPSRRAGRSCGAPARRRPRRCWSRPRTRSPRRWP